MAGVQLHRHTLWHACGPARLNVFPANCRRKHRKKRMIATVTASAEASLIKLLLARVVYVDV